MKKIIIFILLGLIGFFSACSAGEVIVKIDEDVLDYTQEAFNKIVNQRDYSNINSDFQVPAHVLVGTNDEVSVEVKAVTSSSEALVVNGLFISVYPTEANQSVRLDFVLTYNEKDVDYHVNAILLAIPGPWTEIENAFYASVPNVNAVSNNVNLIQHLSKPGASVIWNSNKPNTISNDGVVNKNFGLQTVVLSAILTDNGIVTIKLYTLKVVPIAYEVTEYQPYEYWNGGGEGIYQNPIYTLDDQMTAFHNSQLRVGIPSVGENGSNININLLVVPIEFNNRVFSPAELTRLNKGFFGTHADTGWESLASFYNKTSFGKVNVNGTVIAPYHFNMTDTLFQTTYPERGDYAAIVASADHIKNELGATLQSYDANQDGYFDAIYLVYSRNHVNSWGGLWWAHKTTYVAGYQINSLLTAADIIYNPGEANEIRPSGIMWASQDFMNEATGGQLQINMETFIHESGHLFGLPDFYDYDTGVGMGGGLGGADMMDYNIGDHGPWNKIILGWLVPQVVTESVTVRLHKGTNSGQEALLIPYRWNHNLFSEYLILDYYNPVGHDLFDYGTGLMMSISGVRIYHVDATLGHPFAYNNSYTSHKLIDYLSASNRGTHSIQYEAGNPDLFQTTTTAYNWDNFGWYTLGTINPRITVTVQEKTDDWAVVSISYSIY
ncbi:MAG: hypothetical protein LBV55_02085 [Acholeplasmatales bacterium]|jgi:M6 family metalloprotease-like protein|nr:hypothetical protein [Acholeplasmatales bacterium]